MNGTHLSTSNEIHLASDRLSRKLTKDFQLKQNGLYIKACVQNKAKLCASFACISGYVLSNEEQN